MRGKTLFITGASRGIGLAIALRAARDGANVADRGQDRRAAPEAAGHDLYGRRGDRGGRRQGAAGDRATSATRQQVADGRRTDRRRLSAASTSA